MRSGQNATLSLRPCALEMAVDPVGGAGKKRGAQHQKLAVVQMRQQRVDAVLDDVAHRIEKFIDRRADGDDDRAPVEISLGRLVKNRRLSAQRLGEQRFARRAR